MILSQDQHSIMSRERSPDALQDHRGSSCAAITGTVLSRRGPLAQVQVEPPEKCAACTCASSSGQVRTSASSRVLTVSNVVDAQVGQHVLLTEDQRAKTVAPLVLFVVPLTGLILGALAMHGLSPTALDDINALAGAALGLIAGFAAARQIAKTRYSAPDVLPKAVEILTRSHPAASAEQGFQKTDDNCRK